MDTQKYEARSEVTFRYKIENFSKLEGSQLSPPCYVRNLPWKIMVMPRTSQIQERRAQKSFGFFLQCNGESESASWSCYAVAELRLLSNKEGQEPFSRKIQHLFYSKENDWGFSHFMTWQDVLEVERGYIKDDSITLEVHIVADVPCGVSSESVPTNQSEIINKKQGSRKVRNRKGKKSVVVDDGKKEDEDDIEELLKKNFEKLREDLEHREAEREGERRAEDKKRGNKILAETKQDMKRLELSVKQWKQEMIGKIEELRGEIVKETEKRDNWVEEMTEKEEQDKSQKQHEKNKWEEIEKLIKSLKTGEQGRISENAADGKVLKKDEIAETGCKAEIEELKKAWEDRARAEKEKGMIMTGLGILLLLMILNSYILLGYTGFYMNPRIA